MKLQRSGSRSKTFSDNPTLESKRLALEYAEVASELKDQGSDVKLAKVDAIAYRELAEKCNVSSHPDIQFFRNGRPISFKGKRDVETITNWVIRKCNSPTQIESIAQLREFKKSADVVLLAYYENINSDELKAYTEVSDAVDIPFGLLSESVAKSQRIPSGTVLMLRNFDDHRVDYTDMMDEEKFKLWISENRVPLVTELVSSRQAQLFGKNAKKPAMLLFLSKTSTTSPFQFNYDRFRDAAKQFQDKMLFRYVDVDSDDNKVLTEYSGVREEDCPQLVIIGGLGNRSKYRPKSSDVTEKSIAAFAEDYLDYKLSPYWKTEEVAEDWDARPVKELVGSNFDQVALHPAKHVFVMFYAPWCRHCKKMETVWDDLGELFKQHQSVVIAKLDGTANELPRVHLSQFPTIKLYPAGHSKQHPIDYTGDRSLQAMSQFLQDHLEGKTVDEKDEL